MLHWLQKKSWQDTKSKTIARELDSMKAIKLWWSYDPGHKCTRGIFIIILLVDSSTSSQSKTDQTQVSGFLGMSIYASFERVSSKFLCSGTVL